MPPTRSHTDQPGARARPFGGALPVLGGFAAGLAGGLVVWLIALATGGSPQSSAAGRLAALEARLEHQRQTIDQLRHELGVVATRLGRRIDDHSHAGSQGLQGGIQSPPSGDGPAEDLTLYAAQHRLPSWKRSNGGLRSIPQARLIEVLGEPAKALDDTDCAKAVAPGLWERMETATVGHMRVTLLRPALSDLRKVLFRVVEDRPLLFRNLRSHGGFCARLVRGSDEAISRHAYGLAIDLSVGETLDALGDGYTQHGLHVLADYFREAGWVWGAEFDREDSMHFEVSLQLFESWLAEGPL